jgi:hypothetical protein
MQFKTPPSLAPLLIVAPGGPTGSPATVVRLGLDRRAYLIDNTASAHLHQKSDPGPFLAIGRQVDEGRDAYKVEAHWRDVTAGDSDRLDGLVDGAGPDGMNLDTLLTPDDSGDGPGHRDRPGGGSNFEQLAGRPALARHWESSEAVSSRRGPAWNVKPPSGLRSTTTVSPREIRPRSSSSES